MLASNSKTNTIWNIIKAETNRKVMKVDMFCFSDGNDENYDIIKMFLIVLIIFFLSVADKLNF